MACGTVKTQLHWYGSEHTNSDPFRMLYNTASSEKEAMMCLNDRLGDLFTALDKARSSGGGADVAVYMKAIACLEEEINKLKTCYETEISKQRRELELISSEKNCADTACERLKNEIELATTRLDDQTKENQKRRDEIAGLKCCIRQKDSEICELNQDIDCLRADLDLTRVKCEKYECDSECNRQSYECERKLRQESDDKNDQLVDKLNFDFRIHEQHCRDLMDRLANAHKIIDSMTKELEKSKDKGDDKDCSLTMIIQKVRDKMQVELDKYKKETEEAVNRTVAEMRLSLEARLREKIELETERDQLKCCISQLQGQTNELHGQVTVCIQGNQQLQNALAQEKAQCCRNIREMEAKLLDCQDRLMSKVKEVQCAREIQASLRTEIEALNAMIECQESRLRGPCMPKIESCAPPRASLQSTHGLPNRNAGCPKQQTTYPGQPCPPSNCGPSMYRRSNSAAPASTGAGTYGPSLSGGGAQDKMTPGDVLAKAGVAKLITGGNCFRKP